MRRALQYAGDLGALVVQHPEEPALAQGTVMNAGPIASRLGLSVKTVGNHTSAIFAKLQVAGRAEAIIRAREAGLGR
jgi:DNA-binding NarL/FixJ family response regulator